jgi:hypothetical protein
VIAMIGSTDSTRSENEPLSPRTDSLTRIAESHAPDAVYDEAQSVFSDDELVALSIGAATINVRNTPAVGFRLQHPRTESGRPEKQSEPEKGVRNVRFGQCQRESRQSAYGQIRS